jgi:ABC-type branched-subunit amino acid transport system ATPase component/branched-subunit amino acid ABC-type transport system permease component
VTRDDLRLAAGVGAVSAVFLTFVTVLYPAKPAILFLGLVLGSLSALVAMGLVLVWRANHIVNFAQGDLGGLAAVLAASLIVGPGWSFFPAVAVGLVTALALGALIEVAVIRRFARAPRLVLTVATIGIAQLLQFGELGLPKLFNYDVVPQPPQPFSFRFEWFPVVFNGGHLLILVAVPLIGAGLGLFFVRSRIGVAVRAAAESADRAALLGIPVRRINTLVWVLASGLSGAAVLLRMPIQGVSIGTPLGPSLLLRALAAAVIGRMENLRVTFVAALVLGVVEQAVFFETGRTIVADAVLFFVILGALVVQRRGAVERAREIAASTWTAIREVRPVPRELRRVPEVLAARVALPVAAVAALVFWPLTWGQTPVSNLALSGTFAMLIGSLVILTGMGGQISLGPLAIFAVAAAAAGSLAQQGKDFFLCVAVGALVGAGVSVAIGVPALRIRGPFFAVTSLAFALATGVYFLNAEYFGWLVPDPAQRITRPVLFDKFDLESEWAFYYVVLVAFVYAMAVVWRVQNSRTGRALVAHRDNARAAQAFGISPTRIQLAAFGLSGFVAGMAGALYVFHQRGLNLSVLEPANNLKVFSIAVLGGLGSLPGAIVGAAYLAFVDLSPFTRQPLSRLFASGVGLLLILLVTPAGLGALLYDLRDRLLRAVARRRGIVVPSLLADVRVDEAPPPVVATATAARDPILSISGLEVSYGRTQVLFGVDLHVERGEILALLGTNGAGKSTLLAAVCGLVKAQAGSVVLDGETLDGAMPADTVGRGIVLMPGGKGVFPTLTVAEHLRLAAWPYADDPDGVAAATERALTLFPRLRERWDQKAGNLSGGEQQMLALAMALVARPKLLLVDELSLGLAPIVVEQLLEVVRAIHAAGTTVVLVEQSVNLAITLAQRAVFLEKGEVRFDGPTAELLAHPEILRAVFLEGGARRGGRVAVRERRPFEPVCTACGAEHPVVLETRGLTARFGGVQAVQDVDLTVRRGQVVGIIGPNGAGKTTVLDLVSGFVEPTTGRVILAGADVTALGAAARAEAGLGRSFQDARLFPAMTVRQAIAAACERHVAVRDPVAPLVLSPAVPVSEREVAARVEALIEQLNLGAYADKFVGELSTGTRRIVDIACSLAHDPLVLLLDEPSSGIAQRETEALGPVLLAIRDATGAALVIVEHDMPLICSVADELVAMETGVVVARGAPEEVIAHPRVVEGYLGTDRAAIDRSGDGVRPGGRGRPARAAAGAGGRAPAGAGRRR